MRNLLDYDGTWSVPSPVPNKSARSTADDVTVLTGGKTYSTGCKDVTEPPIGTL